MFDAPISTSNPPLVPIEAKNVSLRLQGRHLLEGLNCKISSAGITTILGPNGAGKSLFMRCIHGLEKRYTGTIEFAGVATDTSIREQQSLVFQTPTLLRRTVAANLLFVSRHRGFRGDKHIFEYLARLRLEHLHKTPARLLSGGEKQRLAVARALITEPQLLLLDEATSNLDPASNELIESVLRDAQRNGSKIIMITHDLGQARRLADDVIFMNQGRICEHRSANAFFKKPNSIEAAAYIAGRLIL